MPGARVKPSYETVKRSVPIYAQNHAITVPVNETNTVWKRKKQQIPRKAPINIAKNDLFRINCVCTHENCDKGNVEWSSRVKYNTFYGKHKHFIDAINGASNWSDIVLSDHLQVVSEFVLERKEFEEEKKEPEQWIKEEIRFCNDSLEYYAAQPPQNENAVITKDWMSNELAKLQSKIDDTNNKMNQLLNTTSVPTENQIHDEVYHSWSFKEYVQKQIVFKLVEFENEINEKRYKLVDNACNGNVIWTGVENLSESDINSRQLFIGYKQRIYDHHFRKGHEKNVHRVFKFDSSSVTLIRFSTHCFNSIHLISVFSGCFVISIRSRSNKQK